MNVEAEITIAKEVEGVEEGDVEEVGDVVGGVVKGEGDASLLQQPY